MNQQSLKNQRIGGRGSREIAATMPKFEISRGTFSPDTIFPVCRLFSRERCGSASRMKNDGQLIKKERVLARLFPSIPMQQ
jgi:hypothetical protein